MKVLALFIACLTYVVPSVYGQDADVSGASQVIAARADGIVNVDGRLSEDAWAGAESVTGFLQFEPEEGTSASQPSDVRVLYGDANLYVGAYLYDEAPSRIEAALGRRDEINRADWFIVSIDSYFDRRTAYTFAVNAAGIQFDAIYTGGGGPDGGGGSGLPGMDESWDAVWYSDVSLTADGWVVEMRIPYSMLRFDEAAEQTWGIHFRRQIPRLGEQVEWPLVPRTERENLVARFGLLTGIRDIEPRRNLQVTPYTMSNLRTREHADKPGEMAARAGLDAGGDVKLGLGPNVTLDATINPDFGQVESDPAVLNLTAFETFFDERRPFFVEGAQIYDFAVGPGRLLYTRRIGAHAPIVSAAKLSGRTARGLSFGLLGATTGHDFSPNRHYGVARMSQQIGDFSSVGGILTGFDGGAFSGARQRAFAGGSDYDFRLLDNRYGIEGFASVTHRRWSSDERGPETGFAGKVWARKRQGAWKGFAGLDVFSDEFNPNELGQLRESDFVAALSRIEHDVKGGKPFGPFLRGSVDFFALQQVSYSEGLNLGQRFELGSRWTLRGFQQVELGASLSNPFGGFDVYETRGLGPWAAPFSVGVEGEFETDERRSWEIEPELGLEIQEDGGMQYAVGLRGDWNVGSRVAFSGNLEGEWENGITAWSSNEAFLFAGDGWAIGRRNRPPDELEPDDFVPFDDGGVLGAVLESFDPAGEGRFFVPLFGERDTRSLDLTLRSTFTFTRGLSLQFYSQLFLARGRYENFQILQDPDNLVDFDRFPKRDEFAFSSFQSNVVLRWEYRPGSRLFVVWTHGRRDDDELNPLAPWESSPYNLPIDRRLAETFGIFPENIFLIKLDYTFLY